MTSLISDAIQNEISGVYTDIHDTFKRDIYLYTPQKITIPASSDFNPLYGRSPSTPQVASEVTLIKSTITARVYYPDRSLEMDQAGFNIADSTGRVRLKLLKDDFESLKKATKIEIDDVLFTVAGDPHIEGPFKSAYYMVYLERIN